jgi:hypothetical protein
MSFDSDGNDLLKYKKDHSVFIETGTATGDGVQVALNVGFDEIYSIELSESLYGGCRSRFENNDNVHLFCGSSEVELPKLLEVIDKPFLLWMDAHHSGGPFIGEFMDVYLPKEIESIMKYSHKFENSVIMIDDMNYFKDEDVKLDSGKTTFEWCVEVEEMIKQLKPNADIHYHKSNGQAKSLILVAS